MRDIADFCFELPTHNSLKEKNHMRKQVDIRLGKFGYRGKAAECFLVVLLRNVWQTGHTRKPVRFALELSTTYRYRRQERSFKLQNKAA